MQNSFDLCVSEKMIKKSILDLSALFRKRVCKTTQETSTGIQDGKK